MVQKRPASCSWGRSWRRTTPHRAAARDHDGRRPRDAGSLSRGYAASPARPDRHIAAGASYTAAWRGHLRGDKHSVLALTTACARVPRHRPAISAVFPARATDWLRGGARGVQVDHAATSRGRLEAIARALDVSSARDGAAPAHVSGGHGARAVCSRSCRMEAVATKNDPASAPDRSDRLIPAGLAGRDQRLAPARQRGCLTLRGSSSSWGALGFIGGAGDRYRAEGARSAGRLSADRERGVSPDVKPGGWQEHAGGCDSCPPGARVGPAGHDTLAVNVAEPATPRAALRALRSASPHLVDRTSATTTRRRGSHPVRPPSCRTPTRRSPPSRWCACSGDGESRALSSPRRRLRPRSQRGGPCPERSPARFCVPPAATRAIIPPAYVRNLLRLPAAAASASRRASASRPDGVGVIAASSSRTPPLLGAGVRAAPDGGGHDAGVARRPCPACLRESEVNAHAVRYLARSAPLDRECALGLGYEPRVGSRRLERTRAGPRRGLLAERRRRLFRDSMSSLVQGRGGDRAPPRGEPSACRNLISGQLRAASCCIRSARVPLPPRADRGMHSLHILAPSMRPAHRFANVDEDLSRASTALDEDVPRSAERCALRCRRSALFELYDHRS